MTTGRFWPAGQRTVNMHSMDTLTERTQAYAMGWNFGFLTEQYGTVN